MEATATVAQTTTPATVGTTADGITKVISRGPITVDKVYTPDWAKDGGLTAQLRQVISIKTSYPSKKVTNSLQDNIFGLSEFGAQMTDFTNEEVRIAWLPVPPGSTKESVQARLDAAKGHLYKILSNAPIITDDQKWGIDQGYKTMEDYANSQVVRFPDTHETTPNQIILNDGRVQYRRCFFTVDAEKKDMDGRGTDVVEFRSPEIAMELQGLNAHAIQNVNGPVAPVEKVAA